MMEGSLLSGTGLSLHREVWLASKQQFGVEGQFCQIVNWQPDYLQKPAM